MKLKWLFHLVVFSILFYVSAAWSANYYFSKDRKVDGYYYSDVYELNLETGNVRIIFPADNKILYPFVLSDQSKIFFRCNWKLCVYDTEQGIIDTISHLGNIERIDNVHFMMINN